MVKISVVIPIYNSEEYLRKCLDSIIYQTYENLEIICVNDGSTDGSAEILKEYENKDKRIKVYTKENTGLSDTRNHGLDKAEGDYVSFIDSDDWVSLTLFDDFVKILNQLNQNIDIYNFNAYAIKENENKIFTDVFFNIRDIRNHESVYTIHTLKDFKRPFSGNFGVYNKIYGTDFLKSNNIWFPSRLIFEDQAFYTECFIKAKSIIVNDKPYYAYIKRTKANIMGNLSNKTFDILKIIDIIDKTIKGSEYYEYLKYAFLQHKYTNLSYFFFETADEKKDEFYGEMKKVLLETKNENFDENIASKLRGYPIYKDVLSLNGNEFFEKYKDKIIKER